MKAEWGKKRQCQECGVKFYDFDKEDIVCPSCGAVFDVEASIRLKRSRQQIEEEVDNQDDVEAVLLDDDIDADIGADDDDDILEDTSDIDNGDDVPVIKPVNDTDEG